MSQMSIIFEGGGEYSLINGVLKSIDGGKFLAEDRKGDLVISRPGSISSGSITNIGSGNIVNMGRDQHVSRIGGVSISQSNGRVDIRSDRPVEVYLNGKRLGTSYSPDPKFVEAESDDGGILEHDLREHQISGISINGSAYVDVEDIEGRLDSSFHINIQGSGDVRLATNQHFSSLSLVLSGSGDIKTSSFTASSVNTVLSGSGDILLDSCQGDSISVVLSGSGDVVALRSSFRNVAKVASGNGRIRV